MTRENVTYTVRVHPDRDGLWAEVAELPGCFSSADTLEELWENLAEAMGLYLSDDDHTVEVRLVDDDGDAIEESREFVLCSA